MNYDALYSVLATACGLVLVTLFFAMRPSALLIGLFIALLYVAARLP